MTGGHFQLFATYFISGTLNNTEHLAGDVIVFSLEMSKRGTCGQDLIKHKLNGKLIYIHSVRPETKHCVQTGYFLSPLHSALYQIY